MKEFSLKSAGAAAAGAFLLLAAIVPARAQVATPTSTPSAATPTPTAACPESAAPLPCAGATKLRLAWSAKYPQLAKVLLSATRCAAPPACSAAPGSGLVTVGPISVTITDALGQSLTKTIAEPGINAGGCPGGIDTYRGPADRTRFIFGVDGVTTVVAKLRIAGVVPLPEDAAPTPPVFTAPLTFTVRDSCGYEVEGRVTTCFTRQKSTRMDLKCF